MFCNTFLCFPLSWKTRGEKNAILLRFKCISMGKSLLACTRLWMAEFLSKMFRNHFNKLQCLRFFFLLVFTLLYYPACHGSVINQEIVTCCWPHHIPMPNLRTWKKILLTVANPSRLIFFFFFFFTFPKHYKTHFFIKLYPFSKISSNL